MRRAWEDFVAALARVTVSRLVSNRVKLVTLAMSTIVCSNSDVFRACSSIPRLINTPSVLCVLISGRHHADRFAVASNEGVGFVSSGGVGVASNAGVGVAFNTCVGVASCAGVGGASNVGVGVASNAGVGVASKTGVGVASKAEVGVASNAGVDVA